MWFISGILVGTVIGFGCGAVWCAWTWTHSAIEAYRKPL